MALIPQEELTTLKSADAVKAVASTAVATQEEMSVAHLINTAANTGSTWVVCNRPISETLVTKLKSMGYTCQYNIARANKYDEVVISWGSGRQP